MAILCCKLVCHCYGRKLDGLSYIFHTCAVYFFSHHNEIFSGRKITLWNPQPCGYMVCAALYERGVLKNGSRNCSSTTSTLSFANWLELKVNLRQFTLDSLWQRRVSSSKRYRLGHLKNKTTFVKTTDIRLQKQQW